MEYFGIFAVCLFLIASVEGQHTIERPFRVPASVVSGGGGSTCPTTQDTTNARNQVRQSITASLGDVTTSINCGGTGWRRVANLDMTDSSQSCPSGLTLTNYSPDVRSCGRSGALRGCWSTSFNTGTSQYREVCGRVRGYQFGGPSAFVGYYHTALRQGLDGYYVEGVSLTHGPAGSRTHIWTFAAGVDELNDGTFSSDHYCPCTGNAPAPPPFVGNNYFCESGLHTTYTGQYIFYPDDPLWDNMNCVDSNSCCEFPYFTRTLPAATTDNIELRICSTDAAVNTDIPIDQVELFVR